METASHRLIWGAILVCVVIALIGFALRQQEKNIIPSPLATSTATTSTSISGVTGTGDFTVSESPTTNLTIPDFRTPIAFGADIAPDVRAAIQKAADTLKSRLAKDSFDLKSWIDLGTVRKMGGDYKGAETAWRFVTVSAPDNSTAFNNLGDLYANFLKNYPAAETNYLTAIQISPADTNPYLSLFTLYSSVYKKGTSAAKDVLKKGIATHPDSIDMQVILARYYKSLGRPADAKAEYDAAITNAKRQGQADLAAQIQEEAQGL